MAATLDTDHELWTSWPKLHYKIWNLICILWLRLLWDWNHDSCFFHSAWQRWDRKKDSFLIQTVWKYILGPSPSNLRKLQVEQMLRLFLNYNHQHALFSTSPLLGCLDCAWSSIWLKHVNQYHTERQIKEMHENCDGEINNSVCLMSFPALHLVFIWLLLHGVLIILSYCILL